MKLNATQLDRPYGQRGKITMPGYRIGVDGKPLCRWCDKPVPKGRRTWCSRECVEEWRVRGDWKAIRLRIIERDKVCRICRGQRPVRDEYASKWSSHPVLFSRYGLEAWGPHSIIRYDRWEVDHIVAVDDGGTDEPANLRLLCRPCHKDRTARQRHEQAARRRGKASGDLLTEPS